jgi:hypothetical protein
MVAWTCSGNVLRICGLESKQLVASYRVAGSRCEGFYIAEGLLIANPLSYWLQERKNP